MALRRPLRAWIDSNLLVSQELASVKFRERYKKPEFKVDKGCRIGRNYEAFQTYLAKNPDTAIVQMDSVIGTKGGKCLSS